MPPQNFPAIAESRVASGDRRFGHMIFGEEELIFESAPVFTPAGDVQLPGLTIHFPVAGVRGKIASEDGSGLRFEHSEYPEWTVATYDRQAIRHARSVFLIAERADGGPASTKPWPWFVGPLLLLAGTIASIWLVWLALGTAHDLMMTAVLRIIPVSVERRLGEAMLVQMGGSLVSDERSRGQLRSIAQPLLEVMKENGHDVRLELVVDDSLNAASLPGDIVVVNSGLISGVTDETELLGVLGHECAHVLERHGMQQLATAIGLSVVTSLVIGDADILTAEASRIGPYLLSQGLPELRKKKRIERELSCCIRQSWTRTALSGFSRRLKPFSPTTRRSSAVRPNSSAPIQ